MEAVETKKCTACETVLPLTAFAKWSGSKDGLRYHCTECHRAYNREYVAKRRARLGPPKKSGRKPKSCVEALSPPKPPVKPFSWPLPAEADLPVQLLNLHNRRSYGAIPGGLLRAGL